MEKEIATHSSSFAWEIPWTEEPGGLQSMELQRVGLQSMELQRVGHNLATEHVMLRGITQRPGSFPWCNTNLLP